MGGNTGLEQQLLSHANVSGEAKLQVKARLRGTGWSPSGALASSAAR